MKFVDAVDGNEGSTIRNHESTDQKVSAPSNRQAIISSVNDEFALASGWQNIHGPGQPCMLNCKQYRVHMHFVACSKTHPNATVTLTLTVKP